ncbi:MAG TPA: tetraacyldisaccharide 4'-kinase [Candidatus Azoamicus sp. OHIO1]
MIIKNKLEKYLEKIWYKKQHPLLVKISQISNILIEIRKRFYLLFNILKKKTKIPIIIVGNINVGGTGKTPFVIHLTLLFKKIGFKPAIISRGYKRKNKYIKSVKNNSKVDMVGDEPLLIFKKTHCPTIVGKKREISIKYLLNNYKIDIIICDDGLQYYKLQRNIEIIIVDGNRYFGNELCIPFGPLREPISRLNYTDIVVLNEINNKKQLYKKFKMRFNYNSIININNKKNKKIKHLKNKFVYLVAGICNPNKFIIMIKKKKIKILKKYIYPDHYKYNIEDFIFEKKIPIVTTEKDAIKCTHFKNKFIWAIPINISLNKNLTHCIFKIIKNRI